MTKRTGIIVFAIFGLLATAWAHPGAKAGGITPVQVIKANTTTTNQSITAVGTIIAPEMANISASVTGHINNILFTNGERVAKGKVLVNLDSATEQAALQKAEAKASSSKLEYQRNTQLVAKHMVAAQTLDVAKAQFLQDQADVTTAQAALAKRSIIAPFAGTVGEAQISVGDYITPGQALVNMVGTEALRVDYSIPENMLDSVALGDLVVLHAAIYPKQKITAKLIFIAPSIDIKTHTIDCQATIISGDTTQLRPGMFVNVKQFINTNKTMIMVPEAAVVSANDKTVVYSVKSGRAKAIVVQTGIHKDGMVQIINGLKAGTQIISSGQGQVQDMQKVKIIDR